MVTIKLADVSDAFLSGADNAFELRQKELEPALSKGGIVSLDFQNVRGTSQSWMNVFLMGALFDCGMDSLKQLRFTNCNDLVKELITFAVQKAQKRNSIRAPQVRLHREVAARVAVVH